MICVTTPFIVTKPLEEDIVDILAITDEDIKALKDK